MNDGSRGDNAAAHGAFDLSRADIDCDRRWDRLVHADNGLKSRTNARSRRDSDAAHAVLDLSRANTSCDQRWDVMSHANNDRKRRGHVLRTREEGSSSPLRRN